MGKKEAITQMSATQRGIGDRRGLGKEGRKGGMRRRERKEGEKNNNNAGEGEAGREVREGRRKGRKEERKGGREQCAPVRQRGDMKEQNTTTQSTGGTQQGHRDMYLFDDKEVKHKKDIKESF